MGIFFFISLFVKGAFYMQVYGEWHYRGRYNLNTLAQGGPVNLDSMWQHRLTRLVRDRYMYSTRITV